MVDVSNVTKRYGNLFALDGVSLTVESGEIFGLLGPNGAGKSTLMKILTTVTAPTRGTATINGFDVVKHPSEVRKHVGYIPQYTALDDWLTGRQALKLFASLYKVPRSMTRERIDRVLEIVDLEDRADDLMETYSGGMKRRLEIATGLVHSPELVVFDEPTLGLDPHMRQETWEYVREIQNAGTSILMATHYLDEADELCDRVAIIDRGEILVTDTPDALKNTIPGDVERTLDQAFLNITRLEEVPR